jgi:hypothetical protein
MKNIATAGQLNLSLDAIIIRGRAGCGKDVENDQKEDRKAQRILSPADEGQERGGGLGKKFTDWIETAMERILFRKCSFSDQGEEIKRYHRSFITMRSILITMLMGGIALIGSFCATVPTKPLAPGELRLLNMNTSERMEIKRNVPFEVKIDFEADGKPEIRTACFYWGGDGPHCFKVTDVDYGSPGTIKVKLTLIRPGFHALESYIVYTREGKGEPTNIVSTNLRVLQ